MQKQMINLATNFVLGFIAFSLTSTVLAANLKRVDTLASEPLDYAASEYKLHTGSYDSFGTDTFKFSLNNQSEARSQTLKQLIYIVNGSFSRPDWVTVNRLKNSLRGAVKGVLFSMEAGRSEIEGRNRPEIAERIEAELTDVISSVVTENSEIEFYSVLDSSDLGFCQRIALVDSITQEIVLSGSCHSEE